MNAGRAAVNLLEESLYKLENTSVGAIRLAAHGLEGKALRLLKASQTLLLLPLRVQLV